MVHRWSEFRKKSRLPWVIFETTTFGLNNCYKLLSLEAEFPIMCQSSKEQVLFPEKFQLKIHSYQPHRAVENRPQHAEIK